jgi:hypothetical protein
MGIEPMFEAWEAPVLPLNYTRKIIGWTCFAMSDQRNFCIQCTLIVQ